jgi:hypothetical protein
MSVSPANDGQPATKEQIDVSGFSATGVQACAVLAERPLKYVYNSSTSIADPGSGKLSFDSASLGSGTRSRDRRRTTGALEETEARVDAREAWQHWRAGARRG